MDNLTNRPKHQIDNLSDSYLFLVISETPRFSHLDYIFTSIKRKCVQGDPPIEVYRASIEDDVGWPAFATEKGSS